MILLLSALSMFLIVFWPDLALAWGPAVHIYLASQLLTMDGVIPVTILQLLKDYKTDFLFGNISADILLGKKYVEWRKHCHNWDVAKHLRNSAQNPQQLAFAYGYLMHITADTVAHNHFIPRQLFAFASTADFGHAYWEIRADRFIDTQYWNLVRFVNEVNHDENEKLMEANLTPSIFSFRTNKLIFDRMILMTNMRQWRNLVNFAHNNSRYPLTESEMQNYFDLSLERMIRFLQDENDPTVVRWDPTGGDRLKFAKRKRRSVSRLIRRGHLPPTAFPTMADKLYVYH